MAVEAEELRAGGDLAVPAGDPEVLRAAGRRMQRVAARALATAAVRGECGPELALHWQGVVADAPGVELGQLSARAMRLLPGVGAGGAALGRYAEALADAQARVRALQGRAVEAREDHRRAVAAADAVGVDPAGRAAVVARADRDLQERLVLVRRGYGRVLDDLTAAGASCARVLSGLAGEVGHGRGALGMRERVLDRLFVAQHEIGQAAVRPVGHVPEREPETWYETAAVTAGDAAAWTWNHTAVPFVNGAANVGEAILEHPEDVLEMALGVGGMVVGAGGELGGLALDVTVVGAPAGAAVHVASTGLIVAGTAAAAHGAGNLAQHALENDNRWLSEVSGPSAEARSTGPSLDGTTPSGAPLPGARIVRGDFPETAGPSEVLARRDPLGAITHYQVYADDGLPLKRVDITGKPHGGVATPHVVEFIRDTNPRTGEVFIRKSRQVREATPEELTGL